MVFDFKKAFAVLCAASLVTLAACGEKSSDPSSASRLNKPTVSSVYQTENISTVPTSSTADGEASAAPQDTNGQRGISAPSRGGEAPKSGTSVPNASAQGGSAQSEHAGSQKSNGESSAASSTEPEQTSGGHATEQAPDGDNAEVNIHEIN